MPTTTTSNPSGNPSVAPSHRRNAVRDAVDHADYSDSPAVRLLQNTLLDACARGASDIHVEPGEQDWRIRLRIDGVLHEVARPPAHLQDAFVTRVKVLARLDIAERRIPQDGRLRLPLGAQQIEEYRVSSLPTLFGEKLVLRRLDALPAELSLALLGLDAAQQRTLTDALASPHGMILVTGPTGSGKTVSLYCFLQLLNRVSLNLCSVEDPAEIQLAGVSQVSVREKAGLTFAAALRAFLRQDPDVIMVGEIRDAETADVAVKAAQTGHLVLSTLHTNDAPATVARLLDIGVAPFNLAAAVRLITAQRLVRKLCPACRQPAPGDRTELRAAGFSEVDLEGDWQPYQAAGCGACHGIGYRGRIGVHQVMPVSGPMRELIVERCSAQALARQASLEGIVTLRMAALAHVRDGITSLTEAVAATELQP
ncbi:GspE/PulE family protein [Burkholderia sp. L27(2015)]|uniref:GspE/PulE family protein n=1 Tax=Burkholderia sp. L27(2015) TaxID=1641858 RepID=UPI00131C7D96|nr:ATPase, T2SS/T4P/T4SS family [Burkholderia sp. L27(2015)]